MLNLLLQDNAATPGDSTDEATDKVTGAFGPLFENWDWANLSDPSWWTDFGKAVVFGAGPPILSALAILLIGKFVIGILVGVIRRLMTARGMDSTLTGFVCSLVGMLLLAFVVIAALGQLGIDTTSLSAIIAAAGLAIGFALQGSLGNFAAGIMLIVFRPFKAGDFIEAGGVSGIVEDIQVFATKIRTGDNKEITVPNAGITGGNIVNYSAKETRRVDMKFGIAYDDDIKKAKETLEAILKADARVLEDPAPTIAVSELGDSSVNLICRPWVKSADYWGVFWDTHEKVKTEFDAAGLSIPFPQRDVHLYQQSA